MKFSLETLRLLEAIDLLGGFGAAARAVNRVPSAVTHAIHRLEAEVGAAVFERLDRGVRLNALGRFLLDEGRPILRASERLEKRVERQVAGWEGVLRIAVDAMIDFRGVLDVVRRFDDEAGVTRLAFSSEVLAGSWDALLGNRADLALGAPGDSPPGSGLVIEPLGTVRFVFVVSPKHPLALAAGPIPAGDVAAWRGIVLADTSRCLSARTLGLADSQECLVVPNMQAKIDALVAGLGIGNLPLALAAQEVQAGRLVVKQLLEPMPPISLSIAWQAQHTGQALRWFLAQFRRPDVRKRLLAG